MARDESSNVRIAVRYDLFDVDDMVVGNTPAIVDITDDAIEIGFEGYGEKCAPEGYGHPIRIERYKGEMRLLVWADINQEDPTHTISLEGAREDKLKVEGVPV